MPRSSTRRDRGKVPSARFEWVLVRIPRPCLLGMWSLTVDHREWGGQLLPAGSPGGSCDGVKRVGCRVDLIEGSGAADNHPDAALYRGEGAGPMQVAVTPFYEEVFQVHPVCRQRSINCFWHTHPLLMLRSATTEAGRLGPPSLGDFFAHSVLSNGRNFRQHRQLNTTVMMAFEGLYIYGVLAHKFRQLMDRAEALVRELGAEIDPAERRDYDTVGELPAAPRDRLKREVFDELRPAMQQYTEAMKRLCDSRADCSTRGAAVIGDSQWRGLLAGATPPALDFPFASAIHAPELVAFARDNPLTSELERRGYYCIFVPRRSFDDGVVVPAPATAHYCER